MTPMRGNWLRCGAHCKSTGNPCQVRVLANGRCKYHGGLSTGPKTSEGKAGALANLKQFRGAFEKPLQEANSLGDSSSLIANHVIIIDASDEAANDATK
jgi:hypothetical protein